MSRETISLARFALFNQAQVTTIEGLSLLFLLALQSNKSRLRRGDEPLVFQSLPDCHWQARQCYVATGSIFKQLDQSMQNHCRDCGRSRGLYLSEFLPGHRQEVCCIVPISRWHILISSMACSFPVDRREYPALS